MATIDYEKKIREYLSSSEVDQLYKSMLLNLFPELAESEDEKIRKEITTFFRKAAGGFLDTTTHCKTFGKWLAWFEKKGEQKHQYKSRPRYVGETELLGQQKPAEWSEEDEAWLNDIINDVEQGAKLDSQQIDWLKSLRPKSTWKPSDEQMNALSIVTCGVDDPLFSLYRDLKKLREE